MLNKPAFVVEEPLFSNNKVVFPLAATVYSIRDDPHKWY